MMSSASLQQAWSSFHSVKAVAQVILLAVVGFGISALFSAELGFTRNQLVLGYLIVLAILLIGAWSRDRAVFRFHLTRNWRMGVAAGLLIGALLAFTVTQQPDSPAPSGLQLVWSLAWLAVVYGLLDGVLLNVLPVMVLARDDRSRARRWLGWRLTVLGLAASSVVTAAYHFGYREYRGRQLVQPLIGNTVLTTGYLITGNAAAPLIGHVIMHGAAVIHGMETTAQLPPHYSEPGSSDFRPGRPPSGETEDSDR